MVRRHFIDGEEIVVVHDVRSGDLVRMPPRAWALVEAADGTRDVGGLLLAASQRGELRRASEVTAVLTDTARGGAAQRTGSIPSRSCRRRRWRGRGGAARRMRHARVQQLGGVLRDLQHGALLRRGSGARGRCYRSWKGAARCSYRSRGAAPAALVRRHDDRRAVRVHRGRRGVRAAPEARCGGKALAGARIYPATFTFNGEAVRVSLGVECACIAKSLGKKDGAPLVRRARRRGAISRRARR